MWDYQGHKEVHETWEQNSSPMYCQFLFKHRIISPISRAISKTPFNFCTDRKSQHPPLHQSSEKHRESQKFHPLLRSSQNILTTSWEKPTARISCSKCQNATSAVDTELCELVQPLRTEGLVLAIQGTCHCSPEQTRLCHCCDSMLFPASSAGSDLRHTAWCGTRETSPVLPRAETLPWMHSCHTNLEGFCAVFCLPLHHTAQELFCC